MHIIESRVRTFLTYFTLDGRWGKIGDADFGKIARLCMYMDDLESRRTKEPKSRRRWKMKLALARVRRGIRNLVDEIHKQTVHWLLQNFDVIIVPDFNAHGMVNRKTRKIRSKTARSMLTWAHGKFRQRLVSKSEEYAPNCKRIIIQNEAYTSRTCHVAAELIMDLVAKRANDCGVARRWTEITMVPVGFSCGLCLIQAWLFFD